MQNEQQQQIYSTCKMNIILLDRKPVFIFGFIISFISVFAFEYAAYVWKLAIIYEGFETFQNEGHSWTKSSENFQIWLKNHQNVKNSELSFDEFIYKVQQNASSDVGTTILEAEWLKRQISITCIVFVKELKLAATIKDTWGKHCNHLLFFSENLFDRNIPVINLKIKYSSSWQFLCEVMNYIWERKNELQLQWIIFVKDDTFVISENLRFLVAPLDFQESYYLGHAVVLWGRPYNVAQAGYVLSYGALHKLMKIFNTSEKCSAGGKFRNKEDYYLAKHLSSLEIYPFDTRDSEQKGTFHGFSLSVLLWGVAKLGHHYTRALYPLSPESISRRSVTFNVGYADKMRTLNYVLYHLYTFEKGTYGNLQAPTPIPDNEVWKVALREEFNFTDTKEISNEQYFQMWRSKYSEPESFILNFRSKAVLLNSNLEPYHDRRSHNLFNP